MSASGSLLVREVKDFARSIGIHQVGIASIDPQLLEVAAERLQDWLESGYHAEMEWMNNPRRQNLDLIMPDARSVISIAINYYHPTPRPTDAQYGKISRYAWGRDYHKVLTTKLKLLTAWLRHRCEDGNFRYYVDTGPISDKFWAQTAGIGWVGKNGNVISREYGSWLFLGEIITNIELTPDLPHLDRCGTCTRCISACPTDAIVAPYVVDANRCIAYHTIENRAETLPADIAGHLHGWVAGCDICQDVCPWNQRFATPTDIEDFQPQGDRIAPLLTELAKMTEAEWDDRFRGSALRRIKPAMWRRNSLANLPDSADNRWIDKE
jgi:epoxyqueuosine reductase